MANFKTKQRSCPLRHNDATPTTPPPPPPSVDNQDAFPEGAENIRVDGKRVDDVALLQAQDDAFAFRMARPFSSADTLRTQHDEGLDPSTPAYHAATVLPGHPDMRHAVKRAELVSRMNELDVRGVGHVEWMNMVLKYGSQGASSNIVLPMVMPPVRGKEKRPKLTNQVLLVHPDDVERICKKHVQKNDRFAFFFGDSIFGTTDNALWRRRRSEMNPAMDVIGALADVFPLSVDISQRYADKLKAKCLTSRDNLVNIHEHLMDTAVVQLQKALFGMTDAFIKKYNGPLREWYSAEDQHPQRGAMSRFLEDLLNEVNARKDTFVSTEQRAEQLAATGGRTGTGEGTPVTGPVGEMLASLDMSANEKFSNAQVLSFAGHDTTGNTMTWLVWELSKRPDLQERLHDEVDALFDTLEKQGRSMQYRDCHALPFMTRCLMETLRLWPAAPWGSMRKLQTDEWVTGPDGNKVWLKAGTCFSPVAWVRHRNPDLWGPDCNEFNPDRDFQGPEVWNGQAFAAWNPSSKRFSPFMYTPRACFGMNFAQMEARTVLAHLFRDFKFENSSINPGGPDYLGQTKIGTLGPVDNIRPPDYRPRSDGGPPIASPKNGLYVHVKLRREHESPVRSRM